MTGAWYHLDGQYHASVRTRVGCLHTRFDSNSVATSCNKPGSVLYDEISYSEAEAKILGYTLCKRCLRAAGIRT